MHKKFLRTLVFIVGITFTLGASPTIAMDDEETPLTAKMLKLEQQIIEFAQVTGIKQPPPVIQTLSRLSLGDEECGLDKVKSVVDLVPNPDGSWNVQEGVWHPLLDTHIPLRIRHAVQAKQAPVPQHLIRASLPVQIAESGARSGDANYQMEAGLLFLEGQEMDRNENTAAMWFRKASEQGHAGASLALGLCLECGYGVTKDVEQAKTLYRLLSSTGYQHPEFSSVTHAAEARLRWLSEQKCCTLF